MPSKFLCVRIHFLLRDEVSLGQFTCQMFESFDPGFGHLCVLCYQVQWLVFGAIDHRETLRFLEITTHNYCWFLSSLFQRLKWLVNFAKRHLQMSFMELLSIKSNLMDLCSSWSHWKQVSIGTGNDWTNEKAFGKIHLQISWRMKVLFMYSNFTDVCSWGANDSKSALIQVVAWCQTGDKIITGPVMTWLYDASSHHKATVS